jgi:hypothetical protein
VRKKTLLTAVFLSILLSAVCGTWLVGITKANPIGEYIFNEPPVITIESPLNNETFSLGNILLVFTLTKPEVSIYDGWIDESSVWATCNWTDLRNKVVCVNIELDGKMYRSIEVNSYLSSPFNSSLNLANLEDGVHSVQIHAVCDGVALEYHGLWEHSISYSNSSDIVYFTVDGTPPAIVIMPVENKTYGVTDIPLNFTLNESISQITYSLDGQANVTITGNTTLTGLSDGDHNVTVYATDEFGNTGVSETMYFSVDVPFPTTTVIAPTVSVAVIGMGLLVYFKKRKR